MKKPIQIILFVVLFILLNALANWAQEPQPTDSSKRRAQIERLTRELDRLKREELLEELQKKRQEIDTQIERLKRGEALPLNSVEPAANNAQENNVAARQAGTVSVGSATPSQTPIPSDLGTLPTPDQRSFISGIPAQLPADTLGIVDLPNAKLFDSKYARQLINYAIENHIWKKSGLGGSELGEPNTDDKKFHCIIHILRWGDDGKVDKQNWYVYNDGQAKGFRGEWSYKDFAVQDRMFGTGKIWLLFVHLNNLSGKFYRVRYDFDIRKKMPAPAADLFSVVQLFVGGAQAPERGYSNTPPTAPKDVWGGGSFGVKYVPSDVSVTASVTPVKLEETTDPNDPSKKRYTGRVLSNEVTGPSAPLDKTKTFDNEGLYWWDVSVGVPIRRISQLSFQNTNNSLSPVKVDKQNIFALLNLYPVRVDVKTQGFTWIPHFVGGVAIAKQPQNKILIGGAFGPYFANFYLGALFVKQQEKADPTATTSSIRNVYKPQFTFGLNLPVRGIAEALKKKDEKK